MSAAIHTGASLPFAVLKFRVNNFSRIIRSNFCPTELEGDRNLNLASPASAGPTCVPAAFAAAFARLLSPYPYHQATREAAPGSDTPDRNSALLGCMPRIAPSPPNSVSAARKALPDCSAHRHIRVASQSRAANVASRDPSDSPVQTAYPRYS